FAFPERDHATVFVGKDLHFNVTRLFQIFFEVEPRITEGVQCFGGSIAPSRGKFRIAGHEAHAFSAATGDSLEQNRITHRLGESLSLFGLSNRIVGARNSRHIRASRELAASSLRSERLH